MELRQVRYFVKVAELGSFSEAARQLSASQSNLSQQVKALEEELGVSLLVRDSHHVQLSDEGEAFYPSAVRILKEVDDSLQSIRDVRNLAAGSLEVGATYSFFPLLLETVREFIRDYPLIKLNIRCATMEELVDMLQKHKLDVALSYMPSSGFPNIDSHTLFSSDLCIICREGHPLSLKDKVSVGELLAYPLALPSRGLQARNTLDGLLLSNCAKADVRVEVNDINMLLGIVAGSDLVTVLSHSTARPVGNLRSVPLDNPSRTMEGAYHLLRGVYCKKAVSVFIERLRRNNALDMALKNL